MTSIVIGQSPLTLSQLRAVLDGPVALSLTDAAWSAVDRGAATIAAIVAEGRTVYGVNTGVGLLANTSIKPEDLETLQRNLVLSHACGVGPDLEDRVVRLMMVLKVASLSRGASGIRRETLEMLIALLAACCLAACTQFPELDRTISAEMAASDYPALVPLEPVLAQATAGRVDAQATQAQLEARVARLRSRAARMRGSILSGRERQRLAEGLQ